MSREIAVIILLALFLASGLFLTAFACVNGETVWPLMTLVMTTFLLVFFFGCGLAETLDEVSSGHSGDQGREECIALGWFVFGAVLCAAVSLPLLLAQTRIVPMTISWESCIGSWSFAAAIALACILSMKGSGSGE